MKFYYYPIIILTLILSSSGCALLSEQPTDLREHQIARQREAVGQRNLVLGMPMNDVYRAWGEPRSVETGSGGVSEQRWIYRDGVSSLGRVRIVYFEQGEVVGWDTINR